jgi:hypothetical protein
MSANARTATAGLPAASPQAGGESGAADLTGRIFRQVTVIPALLAMAWLLAGLPLLLLGHFTPVLMLVISLPLAVALLWFGLRWISGPSQGLLGARSAAPAVTPWWAIIALIAVAVLFGLDQLAYHSQQIIVQRDPASYIQFGNWIARHGSLPIPQDAAAFGGYSRELSFNSPAFYQVGHTIVPQFMAGLPITLAGAFWIGGVSAASATGALLGSCGVLAVGGLIGRLVGPRWAPLGALALALTLPEQFTSRSTYSEPLTQLLFMGGLCMVVDSFGPDGTARRKIAALGGLAIGLTLLVRIDGASDMLPLVPYCGLLVLGRARQAWPLIAGVAVGSLYGAVDGLVLSRPYLHEIKGSLVPLVLFGALLLVVTIFAVGFRWRDGLPKLTTDRLPNAAAILAVLVTLGLVIRPYVQTVHGTKSKAQLAAMTREQRAQHLPIQPTRLYYEQSLHWVFWYLGIPAVILATVAAALLARRCLRGDAPAWTLPLMCFAWIIVATLLRPSIIPNQPWASRRLVPGVLPGFVILAVWAVSWLAGWLRGRGIRPAATAAIVALLGLSLLVPAAQTSFGIAQKPGGPLGIRLVATGLGDKVTYGGEVAAIRRLCSAIPSGSSVLFVSPNVGYQLEQVVRGMCGDPAALAVNSSPARVLAEIAAIRRAGRRPVLLAATRSRLTRYGPARPVEAMRLRTRSDTFDLMKAPTTTNPLLITVWMSEYSR